MAVSDGLLHEERVTSVWTEALFIALTLTFAALAWWCLGTGGGALAAVLVGIAVVFLVYALNYRVLTIRITTDEVGLRFGIFRQTVAIENIASVLVDDVPAFMYYGGAGIHWMSVRGRYRLSLNFLQYPRVVLALKKQAGPVVDVSFTTRRPDAVMQAIEAAQSEGDVE